MAKTKCQNIFLQQKMYAKNVYIKFCNHIKMIFKKKQTSNTINDENKPGGFGFLVNQCLWTKVDRYCSHLI